MLRWALSLALLTSGCASRVLQDFKKDVLEVNEEYDNKLSVKEIPAPVEQEPVRLMKPQVAERKVPPPPPKEVLKRKKERISEKVGKDVKGEVRLERRQPILEDSEGFLGRRPKLDPFRVGEKVSLNLTYFNIVAGYLDMEVLPFVEVNNERAYNFKISAKSNTVFSRFYSVDDVAQTYVNYETLLPYNFEIKVRESKQVADIKSFFDWQKHKGHYWEKKISKSKGEKKKEIEWNIEPFSQNVISAIFYLRNFGLQPGKKLAFHVGDEGNNILFTGEVLRRESLSTDVGTYQTVVVQPRFEVDGVFKPVGDILIWLTDDDRKFVVRIESKIKIGTIVGKLKSLSPGL